jgi:hypothetical protein
LNFVESLERLGIFLKAMTLHMGTIGDDGPNNTVKNLFCEFKRRASKRAPRNVKELPRLAKFEVNV